METLVLFAKAPIAGQTKTRLAKERGEAEALLLSAAFLLDTCDLLHRWQQQKVAVDQNRRVAIYCAPDIDDPLFAEAARRSGARLEKQVGDDLGARLRHAFEHEHERGARAVCVIGSDAPTLPMHLLDEAFRALQWHRVVLGPTFDGGYWLVGAQRPAPEIFEGVPWSTPDVLVRSLDKAKAAGVHAHVLPWWYDVDDAADLSRLAWHARTLPRAHIGATWRALGEIGLVENR